MCSHPTLPLYLSGAQDGSVRLWEWNHQQELSTPQPAGKFAKVTRVQFNQLGNKFGVSDADGNVSLWQVALQSSRPFFSVKANSKQCSDFTFLGSSSVIVTAGESLDHRNVCLWDTLLKPRHSRVATFACLETHGASALMFCPLNQLLLAGGRRGEICVLEVRQKRERCRWQAHETAVKCIAVEPGETFFATGSADGDIKVWSLTGNSRLLFFFPGEHARNTLFRNLGMGVSHLYIDANGRLFSCGADGSMKMRQLPDSTGNIVLSYC
jgi:WD40 repeat protein